MPRRPVLVRREVRPPLPRRDDVLRAAALEPARWHTSYDDWVPGVDALCSDAGYDQSPNSRAAPSARRVRCSGDDELVLLGTVLTVDDDRRTHRTRRGVHPRRPHRTGRATRRPRPRRVTSGAARAGRRRDRARADRPAQPPRLQHAAALGRADRAVRHPLPVAARRDVRSRRLEPRAGARHRRAGRGVALRGGEGGRRWRHQHPGVAAAHAHLPRLDAAQRREREVRSRGSGSSSRCCRRPPSSSTRPRPA